MNTANNATLPPQIEITNELEPGFENILSAGALEFVASLVRTFFTAREELITQRKELQKRLDSGDTLQFLPETKNIRSNDWKIADIPQDLLDRRVEITGPVERKMVINALNSGARVFMADFEDSASPTWNLMIQGQINLYEAIRRTISFTDPHTGKNYRLNDSVATLIVRPRGWHLDEVHIRIDNKPAPAALVDFGLYFFHNAKELLTAGTGPYFYLPKLENHLEARLWNNVFLAAQDMLGLPVGTIKSTVLIETITAAFEMDEILYEMREHIVGLNCGRWDYIFSFIKKFRNAENMILPDRAQVSMTQPLMKAYSKLLIQTCHRRGAHAMGGMAAQIPIKNNEKANKEATDKVRNDKIREASDGHDGTWVAHPGQVSVATKVFDQHMPNINQIDRTLDNIVITAHDLLDVPKGEITENGLRSNINVGIQYIESWLRGQGCVPLYNLMEDAATAEISRAQIWQWLKHAAKLADGRSINRELFNTLVTDEKNKIETELGRDQYDSGQFKEAILLFRRLCTEEEFEEFLTLPAYKLLNEIN